jgi:hypothetical protein
MNSNKGLAMANPFLLVSTFSKMACNIEDFPHRWKTSCNHDSVSSN